ncbi:MAG: hypothetical protein ACRDV4_09520 [Acidimicrobiales bacterium]
MIEYDLGTKELYDVRALALDPMAEVHTRADRATLELRRMLSDLVDAVACCGRERLAGTRTAAYFISNCAG